MSEQPAARATRPALLTVDDDPSVSRSVARDLRRRYGEGYRVVRAESGADALEALREIKLRGGEVAVLLADYRMPQMSGIEFLEEAMDLFPAARRVLHQCRRPAGRRRRSAPRGSPPATSSACRFREAGRRQARLAVGAWPGRAAPRRDPGLLRGGAGHLLLRA